MRTATRTKPAIKVAGRSKAKLEPEKPTKRELSEGERRLLDTIIGEMARRNLSQVQLAKNLTMVLGADFSRAAVGRWTRYETAPNLKQQVALANLFGLSMDELYGRPAENSTKVGVDKDTLQAIDQTLFDHLAKLCTGSRRMEPFPKIRTPFLTLRPDLMVEDEKQNKVFTIFIMQGNSSDLTRALGMAYALHAAPIKSTVFIAWLNHGDSFPDLEPMKRLGLLAGFEIIPAHEASSLTRQGTVFANLRVQLQKVLS